MAKNDAVDDTHILVRWIKPKYVAKGDDGLPDLDENGAPKLIFPQAFELREEEEYLSLTDLDWFPGEKPEKLLGTVKALMASNESGTLSKSGAIACGLNAQMKAFCLEFGFAVRVLEEPEAMNPAHVAVRRYPAEALELYECLATECFLDRQLFSSLSIA